MAAAGGRGRRALLLINRHARRGREAMDAVLEELAAGGVEVERHDLPNKRPIPEAIRAHAREVDTVIVGGGDGTLHAAAPAVLETGLPLGILPLGTANDLARSLGIDPDPAAAVRAIVDGVLLEIDLGEVNGHLFWNVASVGLSASIEEALTKKAKKRWGRLAYGITALRALMRMRRFAAALEFDGSIERTRTVLIAVGSGRNYGGGMTIAAAATPDDGFLHGFSLEVRHWWQLPLRLPALRSGQLERWPDIRPFTCRELELRTRRPMRVDADGSIETRTPARFRVRPKAVRVYVPVPRHPRDGTRAHGSRCAESTA
jgi:diacylglycerol kinase (ATP)